MSINDGGPAFPEVFTDYRADRNTSDYYPETYSAGGMTLRDYLAAKALPALMARHALPGYSEEAACAEAYKIADCMLKARALPVGEGAGT